MGKKLFTFISFAFFTLTLFFNTENVLGEMGAGDSSNKLHYIAIKGGIYSPTGDLDEFSTNFNGEITINRYLTPNFALDANVGYFQTDYSENGQLFGISYSGAADIYSIPITASAKGIIPFDFGEIYAGGGAGWYFIWGDLDLNVTNIGRISVNDDGNTWGFHLLAGIAFDLSDNFFVGMEGKYLFTGDIELEDEIGGIKVKTDGFDLDGFTATALVGFRF
jgi:outer membrane protein W